MKEKFFGLNLDFLGFSASMLCAVHCMAIPIVMAVSAFGGLAWLENPTIEAVFIGLSLVFATWSLTQSYFTHHQHLMPIRIVAVGFAFLIFSRFVAHEFEPVMAGLGGFTIAGAHWVNWRLCKSCKRCVAK